MSKIFVMETAKKLVGNQTGRNTQDSHSDTDDEDIKIDNELEWPEDGQSCETIDAMEEMNMIEYLVENKCIEQGLDITIWIKYATEKHPAKSQSIGKILLYHFVTNMLQSYQLRSTDCDFTKKIEILRKESLNLTFSLSTEHTEKPSSQKQVLLLDNMSVSPAATGLRYQKDFEGGANAVNGAHSNQQIVAELNNNEENPVNPSLVSHFKRLLVDYSSTDGEIDDDSVQPADPRRYSSMSQGEGVAEISINSGMKRNLGDVLSATIVISDDDDVQLVEIKNEEKEKKREDEKKTEKMENKSKKERTPFSEAEDRLLFKALFAIPGGVGMSSSEKFWNRVRRDLPGYDHRTASSMRRRMERIRNNYKDFLTIEEQKQLEEVWQTKERKRTMKNKKAQEKCAATEKNDDEGREGDKY